MPRNVKESDDELETRGGRKTRMLPGSSSVLDSPLRRSTRIKQPAAQNDSSPESNGDSSTLAKTTRRRTIGLDGSVSEATRSLRVRRNSAASDASEAADMDTQAETAAKRITRRSIASLPSVETPSKLRAKAGRVTRAGSESKSTPPVGRITRRTRASSMEVEMTDQNRIQEVETAIKSRKRASALPSEPPLEEESKDPWVEKTILEVEEDENESPHNASLRRGSKGNVSDGDEKMEVDDSLVMESEIDSASQKSYREITEEKSSVENVSTGCEASMEISEVPKEEGEDHEVQSPQRPIVMSPEKALMTTMDHLSPTKPEVDETSASNKENEASNARSDTPSKTVSRMNVETISSPRKSINASFSKVAEKPEVQTTQVDKLERIVAVDPGSEIQTKKDYSLDAKCVVMIETMDVDKLNLSKPDNSKVPPTEPNVEKEKNVQPIIEVENNPDDRKVLSPVKTGLPEVAPEEPENQKIEEETCDDLQLVEITEPDEPADSSESKTKIPNEEEAVVENLSSNATDTIIPESTMDQEKLENTQGKEERDEKTSASDGADSPRKENPEVMTEIPAEKPTVPETPEGDEISSKCEEETVGNSNAETPTDGDLKNAESSKVAEDNEEKTIRNDSSDSPGSKAAMNRSASMGPQSPKLTESERDEIICEPVKDRKSSIVAESPSSGRNAEERSRLKEQVEDESTTEGVSTKKQDKIEEDEESEIFANEAKPRETDDESELAVWASFKELPGNEWVALEKKGDESKETRKKSGNDQENDDDAPDSIDSCSTERNGSDSEMHLDKNWKTTNIPRKNREKGNYDSDDTVIASNEKKSEDDKLDEETSNEDTTTNDRLEADEQKKCNLSAKKRKSLNSSKRDENSQEERNKDSDLDEPNDDSNPEIDTSTRSVVKNLKRRSSSQRDSDLQTPKTPARTPRKSLDSSNSKERKSLNKSGSKDDEETADKENFDFEATSGSKVSEIARKSPKTSNSSNVFESSEDETESPKKLNRSLKSESKSKSASFNNSKAEVDQDDDNNDDGDDDNDDDALENEKSFETSGSQKKRKLKNKELKNRKENSEEEDSRSKLSGSSKSDKRRSSVKKNSKLREESSEDERNDSGRRRLSSRSNRTTENDRSVENDDSDSDASRESEEAETSIQKIPRLLFDVDTSSENENDENDDTDKSIDSDVAKAMNLAGKTDLTYSDDDVPGDDCMLTESESYDSDDDDGADLHDFVVNDDEDETEEETDEENESSSDETQKNKEKKRKRIISPGNASDDSEDGAEEEEEEEEESENMDESSTNLETSPVEHPSKRKEDRTEIATESSIDSSLNNDEEIPVLTSIDLNKSNKTSKKINDSISQSEKIPDLVDSGKMLKKAKHLMPQSSTPKLSQDVSSKKSTPASLEKSAKLETSKTEAGRKSILSASLKEAKTPRTSKSLVNTSLPTDGTMISGLKSPKLMALHRTMAEPTIDSPDAKFLMKEKLNESLPALKIQQAREWKRRLADNLLEEEMENEGEEEGEVRKNEAIEATSPVEIVETETANTDEKKKKKKKKKKKRASEPEVETADNGEEATEEETKVTLNENDEALGEKAGKKSKKRKKNKEPLETMEIEESVETEQMPKKKKKKRIEEPIVEKEVQKKKKKKPEAEVEQEIDLENVEVKKKKKVRIVEPEVTAIKKKRTAIEVDSFEPKTVEKRSSNETKKSKIQESSRFERDRKARNIAIVENTEKLRIKRLPDEVLESLSEIPERPRKRRKIVKEDKPLPSRRMLSPRGQTLKDVQVNDNFVSLSSSGSTTQFGIVHLARSPKKSRKTAARSFRERMLARNPRQPISAYLMYQQKRKASGKE